MLILSWFFFLLWMNLLFAKEIVGWMLNSLLSWVSSGIVDLCGKADILFIINYCSGYVLVLYELCKLHSYLFL